MPSDFRDAADRHFEDAGLLGSNKRVANADHLFGLSAECALKAVMQGLGMKLRADGAPSERGHRVHVNDLWPEFRSFASGRNAVRYADYIGLNPFSDWNIGQRYSHRSDISKDMLESHKKGAEKTMELLHKAIFDGVVK